MGINPSFCVKDGFFSLKGVTGMIHTVMMKFQPGFWNDEVLADFRERFAGIQAALPETVLAVDVWQNCVERDQNADVMIRLKLRDKAALPLYLKHPLHVGLGQQYNPNVQQIISFDREED